MQSDPTGRQTTQPTQNPSLHHPTTDKPRARDIIQGLKKADSPLEFIRQNLKPEDKPDVQAIINNAAQSRGVASTEIDDAPKVVTKPVDKEIPTASATEYDLDPKLNNKGAPSTEPVTAATEPAATAAAVADPSIDQPATPADDDGLDVPNIPAPENFKKLRIKLKETLKTHQEVQQEKDRAVKELDKYKTGEIVPEVLQAKEQRILELEHYEKLHNLKMSKEYQEVYIKPLTATQEKLQQIAADYNIPEEVINQALEINNRADLNKFLSEHFDDLGALEVRQLVLQAKEIKTKAKEAESAPAKALQDLHVEHQRVMEVKTKQRRNKIAETSKQTWVNSLLNIKAENAVPELIARADDPEYNEEVVMPRLTAASVEYGKIITRLAEAGLEDLDPDLGYALARMAQLAHVSAAAIATREAAIKYATDIENNTKRTRSYNRPPIGSASGVSGGGASEAPSSPKAAAQQLLDKVTKKF